MNRLQETILHILKRASERGIKELSRFQIVKLIYLIQIESQKYTGEPFIDNLRFFREKNGPLSKQIYEAVDSLKNDYIEIERIPNPRYGHDKLAHRLKKTDIDISLPLDEVIFLNSILDDYLSLTQNKLKEIVYKTQPMLDIISKEKESGKEQLGALIDTDKVSLDPQVLQALSQNEL